MHCSGALQTTGMVLPKYIYMFDVLEHSNIVMVLDTTPSEFLFATAVVLLLVVSSFSFLVSCLR